MPDTAVGPAGVRAYRGLDKLEGCGGDSDLGLDIGGELVHVVLQDRTQGRTLPGPDELLVVGSTEASGNVGAITVGLTALATDWALATGLVAHLDIREGGAMSPDAAVVGLAVVLGVVRSATAGDVAQARLLVGSGHSTSNSTPSVRAPVKSLYCGRWPPAPPCSPRENCSAAIMVGEGQ